MNHPFFECPVLRDLPEPPTGRQGWPWDEEPRTLDATATTWPQISIIIPSFNQGQYIEETIRSILLQGYPRLELHIIDGGSTDNTVEVINKYEHWLSSWVSEKDSGQSEAINKGFARCSGEIFNWICSDDLLTQGALEMIAETFLRNPEADVVSGACIFQYDNGPQENEVKLVERENWLAVPYSAAIWQPSCFFRRSLILRKQIVREDLHYCMDRELWTYLCEGNSRWEWCDHPLSIYRFTGENKSVVGGQKIIDELDRIYREYVKEVVPLPFLLRKVWLPLVLTNACHSSLLIRFASLRASRAVALVLLALYPSVRVRALQREFHGYSIN